jgi:hypothetical protein
MPVYEVSSKKWLLEQMQGLDNYLGNLNEHILTVDGKVDEVEIVAPASNSLYCGCADCVRREVFAYLIPVIIEGYKDGRIMETSWITL